MNTYPKYDWIEFNWRPKREGLHDSGYRFLRVFGVRRTPEGFVKDELNQWADHVELYGPSTIDVTADGDIRVVSRASGWEWRDRYLDADAEFIPGDWAEAIQRVTTFAEIITDDKKAGL